MRDSCRLSYQIWHDLPLGAKILNAFCKRSFCQCRCAVSCLYHKREVVHWGLTRQCAVASGKGFFIFRKLVPGHVLKQLAHSRFIKATLLNAQMWMRITSFSYLLQRSWTRKMLQEIVNGCRNVLQKCPTFERSQCAGNMPSNPHTS